MNASEHSEDLQTAMEVLDQLNGLFTTIESTTEKGSTNHRLASLGRYMCDDWHNSFGGVRERLSKEASE